MVTRADIIGRGWAYPFRFSAVGRVGKAIGVTPSDSIEKVRMSIMQILGTKVGSRVMDREFGSDLRGLLFSPIDELSAARVRLATVEAIQRWERRVEVLESEVSIDRAKEGVIEAIITLRLLSTQQVFNLVYPYYLTPEMMAPDQINLV